VTGVVALAGRRRLWGMVLGYLAACGVAGLALALMIGVTDVMDEDRPWAALPGLPLDVLSRALIGAPFTALVVLPGYAVVRAGLAVAGCEGPMAAVVTGAGMALVLLAIISTGQTGFAARDLIPVAAFAVVGACAGWTAWRVEAWWGGRT
jgi:hypothetical protein